MATLAELKDQLDATESKISEVIATAQEYGVTGSHSIKHTSLPELRKHASLLRRRIYRFQGYLPVTNPDFGDVT